MLYRLRSLSEQAAFDGPTFSFIYPLLSQVLKRGGVSASDEDEGIEQVTLGLNIVKFHCGQCECFSHFVVLHQANVSGW